MLAGVREDERGWHETVPQQSSLATPSSLPKHSAAAGEQAETQLFNQSARAAFQYCDSTPHLQARRAEGVRVANLSYTYCVRSTRPPLEHIEHITPFSRPHTTPIVGESHNSASQTAETSHAPTACWPMPKHASARGFGPHPSHCRKPGAVATRAAI
jgi:hypothetical protein